MNYIVADEIEEYKLEKLEEIDDKYMNLLRVGEVGETATLTVNMTPTPEFVEAVKKLAEQIGEALAQLGEAFRGFLAAFAANAEAIAKLKELVEYEDEARLDDLTREEWREAEAFAAQKAAARARSYAGAQTAEKAREVRRRRKWRKRIDDRIHIFRG